MKVRPSGSGVEPFCGKAVEGQAGHHDRCVLSTSIEVCGESRGLECILCQLYAARHDKTGYVSYVSVKARDVTVKRREVLVLRGYET